MDKIEISGVKLTKLKQIYHPQGNIFHGIKKSDAGYVDFGEAYFSTINYGEIKSWKKHLEMTLNLIVSIGSIKFVLYDDRVDSTTYKNFMEVILSLKNYYRLTIPPNIWMAFQGMDEELNLLLNIADIEHNLEEITRLELDEIPYNW